MAFTGAQMQLITKDIADKASGDWGIDLFHEFLFKPHCNFLQFKGTWPSRS